ncbi:Divergent polysaccharide deacetylase [Methyloligella halotolerans]|uniref:Divergent polysaccharide deacetylase n=1 Tax=Methyloligella halotolerans TaxID=1177755 RepID=A0A1E2S103_9HYPH|nr:divergent polysaccharide deacetylase family protein [Methyloligella halotolerans]ODA68141.1 Divergent polysaccharide deacetylase [Methyloligella halotolerans]
MKALAITATLVVLLLSLGIAVMAVLPSPQPGEQSVIIDVVPEGQQGAPEGNQTPPGNDERSELDLPDLPESDTPGMTLAGGKDSDSKRNALPPAPVEGLIEQSEYGPLPKVAEDGETPAKVYAAVGPAGEAANQPKVAILMDGLGQAEVITQVLLHMPPQVSIALGPYGRGLQDWVTRARDKGHEVFLQIPLEPPNYPNNDPGPHTLLTDVDAAENQGRLHWLMSRFTGYVGVTNYFGTKFQSTEAVMKPLLTELKDRGLIYVSDGSSKDSVGPGIAQGLGLPYGSAVMEIAGDQSEEEIKNMLTQLEATAQEKGGAIAVTEASPAAVRQILSWASKLDKKGISLVPVSAALSASS